MPHTSPSQTRTWLWIVIGVVGVSAVVVIVLGLLLSRSAAPSPTATPSPTALVSLTPTAPSATPLPTIKPITLTPPPSLSALATQYPQLADILNDPELNSVYKDFLIAYQQGGDQAAITLARQRGILTPQNNIRATLVLDTNYTDTLLQQLKDNGITVENAYETEVDIAVPLPVIQHAIDSGHPESIFKQLTELQHVIHVKAPQHYSPSTRYEVALRGSVIGQGVAMIGADRWHAAGQTGAGVKVGILDCGFKNYQKLLGSELPDRVTVKTFVPGLSDPNASDDKHGTAVTEIVHEVAPDAELYLADYGCTGRAAKGQAVDWLLAQGVRIISNSTGSPVAPMDGTGRDAGLVKKAAQQGVLWVNSSGNEALQHYRSQFTDANNNQLHEFEGARELLLFASAEPEATIFLRWNDWEAADQDLDLVLLDKDGNILAASQDRQTGTPGDEPLEVIDYLGLTVDEVYGVAVYAYHVDHPVLFDLYLEGEIEEIEPATADYSLVTPSDASEALAVGAVSWKTDRITDYSSRGPTTDGRIKPDLAAPSEVDNVTYGHFGGTSAAAPHVAGAAALVWGAHPDWDRQQVWDFLINNAIDYGPKGPDDEYGAGRLQLPDPAAQAGPTESPGSSPSETPAATDTPQPSITPTATLMSTPGASPSPSPALPLSVTPSTASGSGAATDFTPWLGALLIGTGLVLLTVVMIVLIRMRRRPAAQLPPGPAPQVPPPYSAPPSYSPGPGAIQPMPYTPTGGASASCPYCGRPVRAGAKFCAACGKPIGSAMPIQPSATPQPPKPDAPLPPQVQTYCRYCRQPLRSGAKFCAKCGRPQ